MRIQSSKIDQWKEKRKAELAITDKKSDKYIKDKRSREEELQSTRDGIDGDHRKYEKKQFFIPIRSSTPLNPDLSDPSTWTKAMMLLEYEGSKVAGHSSGRAPASCRR